MTTNKEQRYTGIQNPPKVLTRPRISAQNKQILSDVCVRVSVNIKSSISFFLIEKITGNQTDN